MALAEKTGRYFQYHKHRFRAMPSHLTKEKISSLRKQYDELGQQALENLQALNSKANGSNGPVDYFQLLKENRWDDEILRRFWACTHETPDWVDWQQIGRGQQIFYRHALAAMTGLALQGFMVESTASPGNVAVLVRTGGFAQRVLLGRLIETFQWILQVTHSVESLQPGGAGHTSTVRVRLLHALVRQRMLRLSASKPGYYDEAHLGVPINDFDAIYAISNLCGNLIWLQLPLFGIELTQREKEDWVALWRYIGYLSATPEQYFDGVGAARTTMESMTINGYQVSEHSPVILNNFIQVLVELPGFYLSRGFLVAGMREISGRQLCDKLGVEDRSLFPTCNFKGMKWTLQGAAFVQRTFPSFDAYCVKFWRDLLFESVVNKAMKGGGKFDFRYVPKEGYVTRVADQEFHAPWIGKRPVELVGLIAFLTVVASLLSLCIGATYCCLFYVKSWYRVNQIS